MALDEVRKLLPTILAAGLLIVNAALALYTYQRTSRAYRAELKRIGANGHSSFCILCLLP
jgi:hypothetical protein